MFARYIFSASLTLVFLSALPLTASATVYYDSTVFNTINASVWNLGNYGDGTPTTNETQTWHIQFDATTTFPVNKITLEEITKIAYASATTSGCNANVDICDNGWLWIWRTSTSTFLTDKTYVAGTQVVHSGSQAVAEFDFSFYFVAGASYIIEFQPWDVLPEESAGYYFDGNASANPIVSGTFDGAVYLWNEGTQAYGSYSGVPNYFGMRFEDTAIIDTESPPIVISDPCSTTSYSYACTYGLATSTEFVNVIGTSTLNQSITDSSYLVVAKWFSANGNVYDQAMSVVYTSDNPTTFDLYLTRPYSSEVSYLSEIEVCQYFDDVTLMSGYTTIESDPSKCASVIIGAGLTTASTTALAGQLGWLDPETNLDSGWDGEVVPDPSEQESIGEELFVAWYEKVKTFGVFAFWIPTMYILQDSVADYALTGSSSTSTVTTFDVPLDMSAFGLPATTAHLPVSAMFAKAQELSPELFEYIDYFLWGLFWLFILSRILSGAWNVLPNRNSSTQDNLSRFNQNKFAGQLANTITYQKHSVWRK